MNTKYLVPLMITCIVLLTIFIFLLAIFFIKHKNKINADKKEKAKMIHDHEYGMLQARLQEQERMIGQVSKAVHDDIRQGLSFLQMNTKFLSKYIDNTEGTCLLNNINIVLNGLISNAHNISHFLNNDHVKGYGLLDVLQKELDYISAIYSISCRVVVTGNIKTFNTEVELLIYRIVQEAIHNILKHAKATEINVYFTYDPDYFSIQIQDNGEGFEQEKIFSFDGIGFLNMFQRAKYLNGKLDIKSNLNIGSTITLRVDNINNLSLV